MLSTSEVLQLLSQKRSILLSFEAASEAMLYETRTEELDALVQRRQDCIEALIVLDNKIRNGSNAEMLQALNHRYDDNQLPAYLEEIYAASLSVKAVSARIAHNDAAIVEHIQIELENIKGKIESINSGGAAVAEKYYKAAQTAYVRPPTMKHHKKM